MEQRKLNEEERWKKYFWMFSISIALFRLFLALYLDLSPDEAYYWEFSRRLDFSYFDHPPMVGYFIAFFKLFLGNTVLAVRLPSILATLATSILLFQICKKFFCNSEAGFWAVIMLNLTPAGTAIGFITTPDTPLMLFWAIGMYSFLHAINSPHYSWWIMIGLSLGAGALSKYNMIFFVPSIALTILCFKRYQKLVFTSRYWIMVLLAVIGTLPILYWNANHEWISFKFQFAHGLSLSKKPFFKTFGEFLGGQLGTVGITMFPFLCFIVVKNLWKSWKEDNEKLFFLAWLAFPTIIFFTYRSFSSKVEANWPQIAYLSAMVLGGIEIARANVRRKVKWIILPSLFLTFIVISQSLFLLFPVKPKKDISTKLHGWIEVGKIIKEIDEKNEKKAVFIVQGTTLAALTAFYGELPKHRIAETSCAGNYRIWWKNSKIPKGAKVVYVDNDFYSEVGRFVKLSNRVTSSTHEIRYLDRKLRIMNFNIMEKLNSDLILKPNR